MQFLETVSFSEIILKEIELGNNKENEFNYLFDHCIIQMPDTFNISNKDHYKSVWKGMEYDPKFVDPLR